MVVVPLVIAAFVSAFLASEANHCVTACDPRHESCARGPDSTRVAAEHADSHDPSSASSCLGPTCLCHQHLWPPATVDLDVYPMIAVRPDGPPAMTDLGVVQEILHVPRHIA